MKKNSHCEVRIDSFKTFLKSMVTPQETITWHFWKLETRTNYTKVNKVFIWIIQVFESFYGFDEFTIIQKCWKIILIINRMDQINTINT